MGWVTFLKLRFAIRNGDFEKTTISSDEFFYYKKKWFERLDAYSRLLEK